MGESPQEYFGLSCPGNGKFYICEGAEAEFIGCCTSDPCADGKGTCPDEDLWGASFNAAAYEDLATQDCDDPRGTEIWYTCKFTNPPFMGCCSENPCAGNGCARSKVVPAMLSPNERNRELFLAPAGNSSTRTVESSTDLSSKTASSTSSGTGSPSASSTGEPEDDGGLSSGAVAGISIAATLGALVIIGFLIWKFWLVPRRRKQGEQMAQVGPNEYQPHTPGTATFNPQMSPGSGYNRTSCSFPLTLMRLLTSNLGSFASSPTAAYYPSGTPQDMQKYGWSPQPQQYDRPASYQYTDASGMTPHMGHLSGGYAGANVQVQHPQEMDATTTVAQELDSGDNHHYQYSQQDHQRQAMQEQQQSPTYGHNQLGIQR